MRHLDLLLSEYGESHKNQTNKAIHWICIPLIMFSLIGLITCIPFPINAHPTVPNDFNWALILLSFCLMYYFRLSIPLAFGFLPIVFILWWGNLVILKNVGVLNTFLISIGIFVVSWIGQFFGHKIEGKKPSFLKDVQFLLIGPAWLLHFIFKKLGIKY